MEKEYKVTLTAYANGKFRFCWSLETKDKAMKEALRWLRQGGSRSVEIHNGDDLIWYRG
jgi:hypothetical protein